jgi:type I restriction enzyme S subunit
MELKPGYKQTEIGVIPEDWRVRQLGDVCSVLRGGSPRPIENYITDKEDGINWIKIGDVGAGAKYIDTTSEKILPSGASRSRYVKRGDFLLSNSMSFGRPYILRTEGCIHDGWLVIGDYQHSFDTDYLYYCLSSNAVLSQYARYAAGSSVLNLNKDIVSKVHVAIPEPNEQSRISEVLSALDELIDQLAGLVTKKRNMKQAAMQELLTGKRRLKGFGPTSSFKRYEYGLIPEDWNTELLRKVSTMSGRIGWQGLKQEEFTDNSEDPFLITGMNFKEGKLDWSSVYHIPEKRYLEAPPIQLKPRDVLMTKDGTIGKLLFVEAIPHPGKASLNSHLLVLRPINNMYAPEFLYYQLASPFFASHIEANKSGSTFFGLTQAAAGRYPVVLPSIDEQIAIGRALFSIDDAIDQLQHRLDKTQLLKAGILHELLTGRTRLK